jgi:tetratricopeptide (TPR) repeat protein
MRRAALLAPLLLAAALGEAQAQSGPAVRPLGRPDPGAQTAPSAPDLRLFWRQLDAGNTDAAAELLRRWQIAYPGWEPPQRAVSELEIQRRRAREKATPAERAEPAPDEAVPPPAEPPTEPPAGAPAVQPPDPTVRRQAGIAQAWSLLEEGAPDRALAAFQAALDEEVSSEALRGAAVAALRLERPDSALAYLQRIAPPDAENRALEGWARLSLANAALAASDYEEAAGQAERAIALNPEAAPFARDVVGLALLRRAEAASAAGDAETARDLAARAEAYENVARPARGLRAWSAYEAGAFEAAAGQFERLYAETGDAAFAEGLRLSLLRLPEGEARLRALAAEQPPDSPLVRAVARLDAAAAFRRNDFRTARRLDPDAHPGLAGIEAPWIEQAVGLRRQDGDAGQGRMEALLGVTSAGWSYEEHGVVLELREFRIDAGTPAPGDPVGTPLGTPGAAFVASPTGVEELLTPTLRWQMEGRLSPFAALGTTPLGGEVGPLPTGEAGLRYEAGLSGELRVFATPRADSLLSFSGLTDPATGETWGRVVEWGLEGSALVPLGAGFTASGTARASLLRGKDVRDNSRLRVGAGVSYDLGLEGFEYLALGPSWSYDHYAENSNFYSFGHGGYFSPQGYHRAAVNLNLQTEEARDLVLRADLSAGYEWIEEDTARVLPLGGGTARTGGSSSDGPTGSARLQAAWRPAEAFLLGGYLEGILSEGYENVTLGLSLRYSFGGRGAAVSGDLPALGTEFGRR